MEEKILSELTGNVINAAIKVHRTLGPGLLESVYEACLLYELRSRGLKAESQVPVPIVYESVRLESGFRIDILVEDVLVVELKCIEAVQPIHKVILLSYLRLSKKKLGLVINFHEVLLKDGVHRVVNDL